jgi:transporter family-2 protein
MSLAIALAMTSGILGGVNRQVNGRLAVSTSAFAASFINHLVGFVLLSLLGFLMGGVISPGLTAAPWYAFFGGPLGVLFVAGSSWLIPRIGAVSTTLLLTSGQIMSGLAFDILRSAPGDPLARTLGVALILTGVVLAHRRAALKSTLAPRL